MDWGSVFRPPPYTYTIKVWVDENEEVILALAESGKF